jgi:ribosomal protein L7Ae-like RNA K-turn-binding protein
MSEVADMMLAEDQEINALELVGNAREKKGVEKGIISTIKLLRGMEIEDAIIIDRISREFDVSREYVRELMEKV